MIERERTRNTNTLFGATTLKLVVLFWVGVSGSGYSQAPAIWSGEVVCQLNMQNSEYSHQETQAWTITGPSTSAPGAMPIYPGTWSSSGKGALQRVQGDQTLAAQWNSTVPSTNAPIAIFIRASDKRLVIKSWHSQLIVPGGITGVRQVSVLGATATQSTIGNAASEWQFPVIEDAPTSTSVVGSGTITVSGGLLPLGSPAVNATATCKWQFSKGEGGTAQPGLASNTQTQSSGLQTLNTGLSGQRSVNTSTASSSTSPSNQQAGCANTAHGGLNGPNNPTVLGSISAGISNSGSGSLSSATEGHFYQVTLAAGMEANISLSGEAGSDFDLYLYRPDLVLVGCSTTRGTSSESIKTTFGATQNSNTILIEVTPYSWNAAATTFTLNVSGSQTQSSGLQTLNTGLTGQRSINTATMNSSTSPPNQQAGCANTLHGGLNGPNNPTVLGSISAGISNSGSGSLSSATEGHFYQVTLAAGMEANISLSGEAGSDFDLYLYRPDLALVGCSTIRGTSSESIKTTFGATQNSNTILIEVTPYSWNAAATTFTLNVSGSQTQSSSLQTFNSGLTGQRSINTATASSSTSPPNQQAGCANTVLGGSNGPNNPIVLGSISAGISNSRSGSLSSATDGHFYQVTLVAGSEANISLSGDAGSDFDLYLYRPDLSLVGCSTTRGTSSESIKTTFGATQNSNTILIEVSPYSWNAAATTYTLNVSGVTAGSS